MITLSCDGDVSCLSLNDWELTELPLRPINESWINYSILLNLELICAKWIFLCSKSKDYPSG